MSSEMYETEPTSRGNQMTPKPSAADSKAERERVNRLLMKVEVYLNYKLHKQATTALDELFVIDPENFEAHSWQHRVYEMTGQRQRAAEQLVKLASLVLNDSVRANEYLVRARNDAEDETKLREFAEDIGLELNPLFRLPGTSQPPIEPPTEWPFVPDDLCKRCVVVRCLFDPVELRVDFSHPDNEDESLAPVALPLIRMALSVPTHERRSVVFFGEPLAYVVYLDGQFAAVHEYDHTSLGRVIGKFQRVAFEDSLE